MSLLSHQERLSAIVIGAGPSGSTAAYELAKRGIDVAILERETLPRYKLCGGGLTAKTVKALPFDISPVVHRTIKRMVVLYKGEERLVIEYDKPLVYTSMRNEFDHFLVRKAIEQGAVIHEGQSVREIREVDGHFEIRTQDTSYQARVVVGADGANSVSARSQGLRQNPFLWLALESEIPVDSKILSAWKDSITIDLGSIQHGYGWIFPKKDHATVGVGAPAALSQRISGYYDIFVRQAVGTSPNLPKPKGHYLPIRKRNMPIQEGKLALAGDAAGLIEPFTGEGIYYAIRSGQIVAAEGANILSGKRADFGNYERLIDEEIMPEIETGMLVSGLLSKYPQFSISALGSRKKRVDYFCKLIRGERRLSNSGKFLGVFQFLFIAARWSAMLENRLNLIADIPPDKLSLWHTPAKKRR